VAWLMAPGTRRLMGRILEPLAIGLLDALTQLILVCPDQEEAKGIPSPPAEVVFYPSTRWWQSRRRTSEPVIRHMAGMNLDVLHAIEPAVLPLAQLLAEQLELPYCVTSYRSGDVRTLQRLDQRAEMVLAVSRHVQGRLIEGRVLPAQNIRVVPPGVYPAKHATCFSQGNRSASILAGGPLDDYEGYAQVLSAFAMLRREHCDCVFFILGAGSAEHQLRKRAEQLELTDVLTFVSGQAQDQLQGVFQGADIYLSPLALPWLDLHCLQAMAAGIPVLVPDDVRDDFLVDSEAPLTFASGQAQAMAEALSSCLDDRAKARARAEKGLAYLREHHSVSGTTERLAACYREIVPGD
jgi:glycosyltransferase involved in cell wall biosynthesis